MGLLAAGGILGNQFLNLDDPGYILDNPAWRGSGAFARIWLGFETPQYYPLSFSLLYLERQLFGTAPFGYHAVSLALHLLNGLLLRRLAGRLLTPAAAWFAAALWLAHPMQIAAVAWAAEQKTLLSTALALLFLLAALREGPALRRAWSAGAAFVASVLAKSQSLLLPLAVPVFLRAKRDPGHEPRTLGRGALAACLALAAIAGALTSLRERAPFFEGGASIADRILLAGATFWFYLGSFTAPHALSGMYPLWDLSGLRPLGEIGLAAATALSALAVVAARRGRWLPLAALVLYVLWWLPASGLVFFGYQEKAFVGDHLVYAALTGPALFAGWVLQSVEARLRNGRRVLALGAISLVLLASLVSARRCSAYHDPGSFWTDVLRRAPRSWIAHNNLGAWFFEAGRRAEARSHFDAALEIRPAYYDARMNSALLYAAGGDTARAARELEQALRAVPGDPKALAALEALGRSRDQHAASAPVTGTSLAEATRFAHARTGDGRALEAIALLESRLPGEGAASAAERGAAWQELGYAYASLRRLREAERAYREAVQALPESPTAHMNLGVLLRAQGEFEAATAELELALRLAPGDPEVVRNLEKARRRQR